MYKYISQGWHGISFSGQFTFTSTICCSTLVLVQSEINLQGVIYDTGGLALKSKVGMCGMKHDM